ncbi:MAG: T9SS type A sorting domain-containing protein [Balneolales bacterium]|nr:T9SS type A sorting domain-containing protein [Balneolales bacterium]
MKITLQKTLKSLSTLGLAASILLLGALPDSANAQDVLNEPIWSIQAGPAPTSEAPLPAGKWFVNDNNTRGIAHNAATGQLIIISRSGGQRPVVLDAATGDSLTTLSVEGVSGGFFPTTLVDVSPSGEIFISNMTLNSETDSYKIYGYTDIDSDPRIVYSGNLNAALRYGDSFRADFTGSVPAFYVGGSNHPNLSKLTYDEEAGVVTDVTTFTFPAAELRAVRGMSPIAGEDSLWVNEFDYELRKISTATGEIGTVVAGSVFPTKESLWVDYKIANGRQLAAVFPSNLTANGQSASIIDLATGTEIAYTSASSFANANGNGAGGPILDIENARMYLLATNNAIQAYDISAYIPEPPPSISAFNLLSPPNATRVLLGSDDEEEITINWEDAPSTIAWSRSNMEYLNDNFAHGGDGNLGAGGYFGNNFNAAGYAKLPVLDSPQSISMWVATYNNQTVLTVYVEKSDDGVEWEAAATLNSVAGGTGDINFDWQKFDVPLNMSGESYVRIRVGGSAIDGAVYFDDVTVTGLGGTVLIDEDFDDWGSFRELTYTWHLDSSTGSFDPPAFSVPTGVNSSLTLTVGAVKSVLDDLGVTSGTFNGAWTVTAEVGDEVRFAEQIWTIDLELVDGTSIDIDAPISYTLAQNYPNPFNPSTAINFSIAESGNVELAVYSITGQRVATLVNESMSIGEYTVNFDASNLASGVYIYRIVTGNYTKSHKMVLMK